MSDAPPRGVAAEEPTVEAELPRDPSGPWRARQVITQAFAQSLEHDDLYRAKLLTSELVANAVVHGQGAITLRAWHDAERLLVEVRDEGAGFTYAPRGIGADRAGQRGLAIVGAEASRWGIRDGSASVWFELDARPMGTGTGLMNTSRRAASL